jgi:putative serine protease PepD
LSSHQFYIAASHKRSAKIDAPNSAAVDLRRVFKGTAWTTFDLPEGHIGGALLNTQGHIVGILTRYSPFGGAEYGLTQHINQVEGRLRNGEVWGKWRAGTGPSFGFVADPQRDGAKVTKIDAGGPAAQAAIQIGDLVTKIDGQAMRGLDDIYSVLAERDPGHEATVELVRNEQPQAVKIKLAPRTP